MQIVRVGSMKKYFTFSSIVKNASFSKGWLHLAVQCFFAVITVASFILIVMMAIPKYPEVRPVPDRHSRCYSMNCMVYCDGVPYFGRYDEDIVHSVSKLPNSCIGFYLILHNGMFINETLLTSSFPRMRLPIHELAFLGGNLKHLPTEAFLNQYAATIRTVLFFGITIETWTADSLVGLSTLENLYIKNCEIVNVQPHVFRPVHDTLESLTITNSSHWDPANITGTTKLMHLTVVDFSNNIFRDVLNKHSFVGLERCKILYLNSCKISAIGAGAFDYLYNIETLFLNNNFIVTIPTGLFTNIITMTYAKPRINLQDNLWRCNCSQTDLRQLVIKDMLLTDPNCVSPIQYNDKTFFEFESYCSENRTDVEAANLNPTTISTPEQERVEISGVVYVNNGCYIENEDSTSKIMKVMAPVNDYKCSESTIYKSIIQNVTTRTISDVYKSDWIKFTFFITTGSHSIVQLTTKEASKYGIMWYQSTCPNEVYCVNMVPDNLMVYNIDMAARYIFCPVLLSSGSVEMDKCVNYDLSKFHQSEKISKKLSVFLYLSTGGICLVLGALCVYALVHRHPNLLKGSKRILFVKHKTVDALVLPPKVPLRNNFVNEDTSLDEKKIFTVPSNTFDTMKFNRSKSTRSSKSNAPSYISALQPTEDQLAEWRIRSHFTNDVSPELYTYSWICNTDSFHYMDVVDIDKTYESLK